MTAPNSGRTHVLAREGARTRSNRRRPLAFLLGVTLAVGLGPSVVVAKEKKQPEATMSGMPTSPEALQEWMEKIQSRMGKGPAPQEAVTTDGVQVVLQTGHAAAITALAMSRDGRYIVSGSQDETAKVWDAVSGQELRTLSGFTTPGPSDVGFTNDG
jgi:WD40 repeat protein